MVSPPLLQYIVEHARELVLENASLLLILSILNYSLGMLYKYNGFNVAVNVICIQCTNRCMIIMKSYPVSFAKMEG